MPAALAASWGFMLPAGTGPNAIAWATGRIHLPRMVGAGILLDLAGVFLLVFGCWAVRRCSDFLRTGRISVSTETILPLRQRGLIGADADARRRCVPAEVRNASAPERSSRSCLPG